MGKIHMSVMAGVPVRTLRRLFGINAHRPSSFNTCIGAQLKNHVYKGTTAPGEGGQNNQQLQQNFRSAVASCAASHQSSRSRSRGLVGIEFGR